MVERIITRLFGSKAKADLKQLLPLLHQVNAREGWALRLSGEEMQARTEEWRVAVAEERVTLDAILPEAFAMAREAARRVLGERPYDVQILGALVLHQGRIMEMKTGEGKTLSSVPAVYLNALSGQGVHIVTVNDYLAERDANWMGPVYAYLGVRAAPILSGMDQERRREAYRADITFGTNNEFGFDYLRDNMVRSAAHKVQRGHNFCVVDEIDSILIDEARTPLIISGQTTDDTSRFREVNRVVLELTECDKDPDTGDYPEEPVGDYKLDEKGRRVSFTDEGLNSLERLLAGRRIISGSLFDQENFEYIHYATQALRSHKLFHRDQQYVVREGKVEIVDEFTGRILTGRRYSDGLHQALEAKEGIRVQARNRTLATITIQNFFRLYTKIAGMTGTAETEAKEFGNIYGLDVVVVPTNRPVARMDQEDVVFATENDKFLAIAEEIERLNKKGQPVLVGTVSIERSERLSAMLKGRGIPHQVLNAKQHSREALIIAEAGARGSVTIATNMAGRGTDIKLGGNPEFRARRLVTEDDGPEAYTAAYRSELATWRPQYEEVQSLGGLYVLGTERHESRRIDNQLRGRSGRQGDPGESRFFISMDDDLMRLFGRGMANVKSIMQRGLEPGEPLNHPLISRSIERAQKKVEERNFDIRKHLLEYDDVVNSQRSVIYEQRDAIMGDTSLVARILQTAEDVLDEALDEYATSSEASPPEINGILESLREQLLFSWPEDTGSLHGKGPTEIRRLVVASLSSEIKTKAATVGEELFNAIIRYEYLRTIDQRWLNHLENLDELREAVYLRSYAQKNPLLEYKLEGFKAFDEMLGEIRVTVARKMFAVRAEGMEVRTTGQRPSAAMQTSHRDLQLIGAGAPAPAAASGASGASPGASDATRLASQARRAERAPSGPPGGGRTVQIKRSTPKVGRNDPCPCGSGKKYKHCHGRNA